MKPNSFLGWITGRLSRNIVFWLLFTLYHFVERTNIKGFYFPLLVDITIVYGIPAYVNNMVLIPRVLYRGRYLLYAVLFTGLWFLSGFISIYNTSVLNGMYPGLHFMGSAPMPLYVHMMACFWVFLMLAFGKYMGDAVVSQNKLNDLQKQRLESELDSLKSQINPHFLFNALNTLYGMARRTDHETADAVLKLSDILRYVLYDCNGKSISLEKEIQLITHYTEFAKLRSHNSEAIQLAVSGERGEHHIAPLLLLPFVENAIKHSIGKQVRNSWVDIKLHIGDGKLKFNCINSNYKKSSQVYDHKGIGLKNVMRRLELLYPSRHQLQINNEPQHFSVQLTLEL